MRHETKGSVAKMLEKEYLGEIAIGLANRWFQPLTHVSEARFPSVTALCCQRGKREKRGGQRFRVAQFGAQSVPGVFA